MDELTNHINTKDHELGGLMLRTDTAAFSPLIKRITGKAKAAIFDDSLGL